MILLHSNSDVHNLSKFIATRLLANPDIAAEYAHPTVPNYFKPGYEEALCKFALKKFLLLVCFLDHAKRKRLIDHDPCLFNKESQIKVLTEFILDHVHTLRFRTLPFQNKMKPLHFIGQN